MECSVTYSTYSQCTCFPGSRGRHERKRKTSLIILTFQNVIITAFLVSLFITLLVADIVPSSHGKEDEEGNNHNFISNIDSLFTITTMSPTSPNNFPILELSSLPQMITRKEIVDEKYKRLNDLDANVNAIKGFVFHHTVNGEPSMSLSNVALAHFNPSWVEKNFLNQSPHYPVASRSYSSLEVVVVCGVDGNVRTLDAWTGRVRGEFRSGGALVGSSSKKKQKGCNNKDYEAVEWKETIVPGLDGNLYSLTPSSFSFDEEWGNEKRTNVEVTSYHLQQIPLRIEDIVQSPVKRCSRPDCSVVMGQRTLKLFGIDPIMGTVRWMQVANGNEEGFTTEDFATHNGGDDVSGNRNTIIIQREDYVIRSFNKVSGKETWQVTLGRISALDFKDGNNKEKDTIKDECRVDSSILGVTFMMEKNILEKFAIQHEIMNGKSTSSKLLQKDSFPLISFYEDGTGLVALDESSGEVLWEQTIDSIVAAIYGVDKNGSWISVSVVDGGDSDINSSSLNSATGAMSEDPVWISKSNNQIYRGFHVEDDEIRRQIHEQNDDSKIFHESPGNKHDISITLIGGVTAPFANGVTYLTSLQEDFRCPNQVDGTVVKLRTFSSELFVDSPVTTIIHTESLKLNTDNRGIIGEGSPYLSSWSSSLSLNVSFPPEFLKKEPIIKQDTNFNIDVKHDDVYINPDNKEYYEFEDEKDLLDYFTREYQSKFSKGSHKTRNGIFLTWKMVAFVFGCIVVIILGGRVLYIFNSIYHRSNTVENRMVFNSSFSTLTNNLLTTVRSYDDDEVINTKKDHILSSPTAIISSCNVSSPITLKMSDKLPLQKSLVSRTMRSSQLSSQFLNNAIEELSTSCISLQEEEEEIMFNGSPKYRDLSHDTNQIIENKMEITDPLTHNELIRHLPSFGHTVPTPRINSIETNSKQKVHCMPLVGYSRYRSEFRELSPLGKGGFGTVFRCINGLDGREYAVKKVRIPGESEEDERFSRKLRRVLREVKILAVLDHPNIVRYYTAWLELEDEGTQKDRKDERNEDTSSTPTFRDDTITATSQRNGTKKILTRGFSTEILAGCASSSIYIGNNPLGWNDFVSCNNPIISLGNNSKENEELHNKCKNLDGSSNYYDGTHFSHKNCSLYGEEDLGFTWLRDRCTNDVLSYDSNTQNTSNIPRVSIEPIKMQHLSTIKDENSSAISDCSFVSNVKQNIKINMQNDKSRFRGNISDAQSGIDVTSEKMQFVSSLSSEKKIVNLPTTRKGIMTHKHILYIQMQLCQKTLHEFFQVQTEQFSISENHKVTVLDIPSALRMFGHIACGVKHVHEQGLIHRDLKPSNCFMDGSEVVKIGDFGLSRESNNGSLSFHGDEHESDDHRNFNSSEVSQKYDVSRYHSRHDNTAGVGTSSYASPEQMNGSDYDASTDVYSLGIILFEICYPMYTGMERIQVFDGLRKRNFPDRWHSFVAIPFPSLHNLLMAMLSHNPSERPKSSVVAHQIQLLLGEHTVSLDQMTQHEGSIFLRLEAEDNEGVLARTMKIIKATAPNVTILQYSLRGHESKAILEFAISIDDDTEILKHHVEALDEEENEGNMINYSLKSLFIELEKSEEITMVRQIHERQTRSSSIGTESD